MFTELLSQRIQMIKLGLFYNYELNSPHTRQNGEQTSNDIRGGKQG